MAHIRLGGLIFFFMRLILDQREGGERVGGDCGRKLGRSGGRCKEPGVSKEGVRGGERKG